MLYRVQEWLAGHVRFVQYPRLRRVVAVERKPVWGANFSVLTKVALALLGLPLIIVGVVGAAVALYVLWALLASIAGV